MHSDGVGTALLQLKHLNRASHVLNPLSSPSPNAVCCEWAVKNHAEGIITPMELNTGCLVHCATLGTMVQPMNKAQGEEWKYYGLEGTRLPVHADSKPSLVLMRKKFEKPLTRETPKMRLQV